MAPPWFHPDDQQLGKSGIWGYQTAILQGESVILRVSKPRKNSGRLLPWKIGHFGVSKREFTREIGRFEGPKTQNFPAAEGGKKISSLDPPNRPINTLETSECAEGASEKSLFRRVPRVPIPYRTPLGEGGCHPDLKILSDFEQILRF